MPPFLRPPVKGFTPGSKPFAAYTPTPVPSDLGPLRRSHSPGRSRPPGPSCPHLQDTGCNSHRQVQLSSKSIGQRLCASLPAPSTGQSKSASPGRQAEARHSKKPRRHLGEGQDTRASLYKTAVPQNILFSTFTAKRFRFRKPRRQPDCCLDAVSTPQVHSLIQQDVRPPQWELPLITLVTGKRER